MFCSNCGNEVNENIKYCIKCGEQIKTFDKKKSEMQEASKKRNSNKKKTSFLAIGIVTVVCSIFIVMAVGKKPGMNNTLGSKNVEITDSLDAVIPPLEIEDDDTDLLLELLEKKLIPLYGVAEAKEQTITSLITEGQQDCTEFYKPLVGIHDVFIGDYNGDERSDMLLVIGDMPGAHLGDGFLSIDLHFYQILDREYPEITEDYQFELDGEKYLGWISVIDDKKVLGGRIEMQHDVVGCSKGYGWNGPFVEKYYYNEDKEVLEIVSISEDDFQKETTYQIYGRIIADDISDNMLQFKGRFCSREGTYENETIIDYLYIDDTPESLMYYLSDDSRNMPIYRYPDEYEEGKKAFYSDLASKGIDEDIREKSEPLFKLEVTEQWDAEIIKRTFSYNSYNKSDYLSKYKQ